MTSVPASYGSLPSQAGETVLDDAFDNASRAFAGSIAALSSNPIIRAALIGPAMASVILALEIEFPDCLDKIEDALESQLAIMRDEARERNANGA